MMTALKVILLVVTAWGVVLGAVIVWVAGAGRAVRYQEIQAHRRAKQKASLHIVRNQKWN